ncbi:hypothetical protein A2851_03760 [Candidatus Kaiserbacteria bacterium RIFCSPHIGHO2_01_FULL_53_29]|uniref:SET domain-containing protein n=1 Tax=Candidatus Kaiserbacteria bacterium RIFCSPHIGHO2_01_FULL_53_29 TaxID=1798480 RepID=A0A1F6CWK4_9BACT|nr:MAG: hypothetical protein A2851_03760 [Candidatus Kaiserbacteria bacterium RIFCSPHIGHO2_01_FULL_53_29]
METVATPVVVRRSRSGLGYGLFAAGLFQRGDFLAQYTGTRIPTSLADTLKSRYLFEIDSEWTIDGSPRTNIARYINHSCQPNAQAEIRDGRILIYAAEVIHDGEEVTIDYDEEYFDEFIRPAGCKCAKCAYTLIS